MWSYNSATRRGVAEEAAFDITLKSKAAANFSSEQEFSEQQFELMRAASLLVEEK